MATYVIGDIHGCYDDFISMLKYINYDNNEDSLILLGDYIDRGNKSYEMIQWIINNSLSSVFIRGNHEEEFIQYINILNQFCQKKNDMSLYECCEYLNNKSYAFDYYGTIRKLIKKYNISLKELNLYANLFKNFPLYFKIKINDKHFLMAHAGYIENKNNIDKELQKEFCLYAREENLKYGGIANTTIITGHTPTILKDEFSYNCGKVFKFNKKEINCIFYDIDCGCVFKYDLDQEKDAKLACIKLENMEIFYI